MVEQIFLSAQVKQSMIIVINWYVQVASRAAKRLKTNDLRKLGIVRKISKLYRIIV